MLKLFGAQKPPIDKIETVIGSNTSFNGHLKCDGNVRIDGLVESGTIETVGNVVVTPQGRVAAKIIAEHVSVAGEVTGAIEARGHLEILSTGRVIGDVRVANFYKDEGGILRGKLQMGQDIDFSNVITDGDDSRPAAEPSAETEAAGSREAAEAVVAEEAIEAPETVEPVKITETGETIETGESADPVEAVDAPEAAGEKPEPSQKAAKKNPYRHGRK